MANANLFQTLKAKLLPAADARNFSGAPAYELSPKAKLAQYAATGCLNATYYASAEAQLDTVLALCEEIDAEFIAQTAVYCRERGYMKDMPALLTAVLAAKGAPQLARTFKRTIDSGKMLRNFVQIVRSGATGRQSLGTRPKKLVQAWLNQASEKELLAASVGNAPSLADVVKMVHPKPQEEWRAAFFAWLIGKPYDLDALPPVTRAFELIKREGGVLGEDVPAVPFQMLTALDLSQQAWAKMARDGGWHMVRMNLNTFARHGVFENAQMILDIVAKLRNPELVAKAKVFPYQLMAAYMACDDAVPGMVREALQDAMELALANVPEIDGKVVVCPDVSGSMSCSVSGYRPGATSVVRCIDVAALVAAAILRKNANAQVLPFECKVVDVKLNPRDSVMTNAQRLASVGGGGTNCSAPLARLNQQNAKADLVVFVSDNESWIDASRRGATATMVEWNVFKQRNPKARLVCIDVAPHPTTQARESADILNVGGFSDNVFNMIAAFAAGQLSSAHWVGEIGSVSI